MKLSQYKDFGDVNTSDSCKNLCHTVLDQEQPAAKYRGNIEFTN